jgi:hypothetical protein
MRAGAHVELCNVRGISPQYILPQGGIGREIWSEWKVEGGKSGRGPTDGGMACELF